MPKEQVDQQRPGTVECGDYTIVNNVMEGQCLVDTDGEVLLHYRYGYPLDCFSTEQIELLGAAFKEGLEKGCAQGKSMQLDELHCIFKRIVHGKGE